MLSFHGFFDSLANQALAAYSLWHWINTEQKIISFKQSLCPYATFYTYLICDLHFVQWIKPDTLY